MKIISTLESTQYGEEGHPERPERVSTSYSYLQENGYSINEPTQAAEQEILAVHDEKLLTAVKYGQFFDADTPRYPNIFSHALRAAGGAKQAATFALNGQPAFSLMRPPGHHAGKNFLGGFCYFNNIVIGLQALKSGKTAILDIDVHHGNGTQDIVLGNANTLYVSLHQSPLFPGTGLKSEQNCKNYPIPAFTGEELYLKTLQKALEDITTFKPDLLGISAGFDTYKDDLIGNLNLDIPTYKKIARLIKNLEIPTFAILEGGYNITDMPKCIEQFLEGIEFK